MLKLLVKQEKLSEIKPINISQFSNTGALNGGLDIVCIIDNTAFEDMRYYFYPESKLHVQWKDSENHYKWQLYWDLLHGISNTV